MPERIKIIHGSLRIFLSDCNGKPYSGLGSRVVRLNDVNELRSEFQSLVQNSEMQELWFCHSDVVEMLEEFKKQFTVIEAAGGLVRSAKGNFLAIFRNGTWDLPKGKIEKGERIEHAALREVEEECGIQGVVLDEPLLVTYHTYVLKDKLVLKPTHWFAMHTGDEPKLIPQTEEGITDVQWMSRERIAEIKASTFETIRDVLDTLPG